MKWRNNSRYIINTRNVVVCRIAREREIFVYYYFFFALTREIFVLYPKMGVAAPGGLWASSIGWNTILQFYDSCICIITPQVETRPLLFRHQNRFSIFPEWKFTGDAVIGLSDSQPCLKLTYVAFSYSMPMHELLFLFASEWPWLCLGRFCICFGDIWASTSMDSPPKRWGSASGKVCRHFVSFFSKERQSLDWIFSVNCDDDEQVTWFSKTWN